VGGRSCSFPSGATFIQLAVSIQRASPLLSLSSISFLFSKLDGNFDFNFSQFSLNSFSFIFIHFHSFSFISIHFFFIFTVQCARQKQSSELTSVVKGRTASLEFISFTIRNTELSFANALRRIFLSFIPCLSISHVSIQTNTSVSSDEFLAHAVGLVPLSCDPVVDDLLFNFECHCTTWCEKCSITLQLDVTCTDENVSRSVTSDDLIFHNPFVKPVSSHFNHEMGDESAAEEEDRRTAGRKNAFLLTKLTSGQQLHFTAIAQKGVAIDNARFSCTAGVSLRQEDVDGRNGDCETTDISTFSPSIFHFTVNSNGSMAPEKIVLTGIAVLKKKLQLLKSVLL
jgi:DNA-directed RNA polymerase II subunit RPB3